jgi:hypothetical protein
MADTRRCRVALLVRLLVACTSGYQVTSLVQDVAKRLILSHRRSPKPPGSEADRRYKARSDPRYHMQRFASLCTGLHGQIASPPDWPRVADPSAPLSECAPPC